MTKQKLLNLCGAHLHALRKEKKLTLTDLQAALEVEYGIFLHRTNLGRIERGVRTVSDVELAALAQVLNTPIENLLWGKDHSPGDVNLLLKKVRLGNEKRRGSQAKDT